MVLVKNCQLFHLFILGKIDQENVFHDILARKNAFPDYKNKNLKKVVKLGFFKGVSPWFWSKIGNLSIFSF